MSEKKKWYHKTGGVIFLLIIFFPVGLYMMWKHTNWNKKVKWVITILFALALFINVVSPDEKAPQKTVTEAPKTESNQVDALPTAVQQTAKQYVTVFESSGSANKKTDSFTLKGGKQRLTYTFEGADPLIGAIYVMEEGKSKEKEGGIYEVMAQQAGTDETILRKSAGTYYIDVTAANASWTVKIEEEQ